MNLLSLSHKGTRDIETGRLLLRRFVMGDADEMFREWAGDANVTEYLTWEPHRSVSETKTFLMNTISGYGRPDKYCWAIALKESDTLIGSISADITDSRAGTAVIGYCLGERFRNCGYMTETLRAVEDYMFYDVNINRVEAYHSVNNPASGRVMVKTGMIKEGRSRLKYITGAGKYQDADLYGLVKEDFEESYKPPVTDFLDLRNIDLTAYGLSLKCTEYYDGNPSIGHVPSYTFDIVEKNSGTVFGEISLRLGFNENLYYGGHIGYSVEEEYRNMGVATASCGIILNLVRAHGFKKIIITNSYTNKASRKVCEKIGGKLIRIARLPQWHDLYIEGQRFVSIYEITAEHKGA